MMLLFYLLLLLSILVMLIDGWALLVLHMSCDKPNPLPEQWPLVAVLLPVRNEEEHLPACLQSLLQLNYPADKLLVLIGNDASTDATAAIAAEWQQKHAGFRLYHIEKNLGSARGKANVLAQLVHHCPAETAYFFMTDADIRPHPDWLKRMLRAIAPGIGIVNGTTAVKVAEEADWGSRLFFRWQEADWALALGLTKAYTYLPFVGKTLTAIGNNMLISREAYEASGGYESFPFSITEDFELLQQISRHGYRAVQLMEEESSALTEPVRKFSDLLHQRKRWMTGALRLPLVMVLLLIIKSLFFPVILLVLWLHPPMGLALLLIKLLLQLFLAQKVLKRLGISKLPAAGLFYELYAFFVGSTLLMFYILPLKINWKGRTYRSNRA